MTHEEFMELTPGTRLKLRGLDKLQPPNNYQLVDGMYKYLGKVVTFLCDIRYLPDIEESDIDDIGTDAMLISEDAGDGTTYDGPDGYCHWYWIRDIIECVVDTPVEPDDTMPDDAILSLFA